MARKKPKLPPQPKLEDCVLVVLTGSRPEGQDCDACVRVHARSGLYGPECRDDGFDCGYTGGYDSEWEDYPRVWVTKVDAVVYRLTGVANVAET